MLQTCKYFIYKFELIGPVPQLMIFNNTRYQSVFSSIMSIIIILLSLIFSTYSLIVFFKYESPNIVYTKANDQKTKREIYIKGTPLIFQLVDSTTMMGVDKSVGFFEGEYFILFDNGTFYNDIISIENCQLGKNMNLKAEEYFNDKYSFERNLEDFYCINSKSDNLSLFYHPNIGYSSINLHIILNNNTYIPEKLMASIVSESDLIDHNNRDNPISKNYIYQFIGGFNSLEYSKINFNFQYVKYESDDGLFFKDEKLLNGMSFSDMSYYRNILENYNLENNFKKYNNSKIGTITFAINKSNYDNYKRNYTKIQTLLAEVMSVVSLLFEIGRQIANILFKKKMSNDIINNLINNGKKIDLIYKNFKVDKLYNYNIKNSLNPSDRKNISHQTIDKANNLNLTEKSNQLKLVQKRENNEFFNHYKTNKSIAYNNQIKKINYFHILKSYLCFKDEKSKTINVFHTIINENMSVEKILERFYNLENIYNYYLNKKEEYSKYKKLKKKIKTNEENNCSERKKHKINSEIIKSNNKDNNENN